MQQRKVGLIVGSLRQGAYSRLLARSLLDLAPASFKWSDLGIGSLPFYNQDLETDILAASIRTVNHVKEAALIGADVATIPPGILKALVKHPLTDAGLAQFVADWKKTGQTI